MNPPTVAVLRASNLAAYTYTRLAEGDPLKVELRPDYLASLARHHQIKAELVPLIKAWHEQGIEVLVYKGFYFAEFVYPAPGARHHGDVDLLFRPEDASRALDLARSNGWTVLGEPAAVDWRDEFIVFRRGGATRVDGHRLVVRQSVPGHSGPRRLSKAFWDAAVPTPWEGTTVRLPSLADSVLVGLVLDRCVGDGWQGFKPHDVIDLRLALDRGVTFDQLRARAREVGFSRTLALALDCYDSARGTLNATRWWSVPWRWGVGLLETGAVRLPLSLERLPRGPALAWDVVRVLPAVMRARRALAGQRDVREVLRSVTPGQAPRNRGSRLARWRTVRAIRWAFKLFRLGPPEGDCLPQALTTYSALRQQGWPVVFVSGVRRDGGAVVGHAWVELDGAILSDSIEEGPMPDYRENFRYPTGSA